MSVNERAYTLQAEPVALNEIRVVPAVTEGKLVLKGDLYDVEHADLTEARVKASAAAEVNEFAVAATAPGVALETAVTAGEITLESVAAESRQAARVMLRIVFKERAVQV
jgi:hypothetical protein